MNSLRRCFGTGVLATLLATLAVLAQPAPQARANPLCDAATLPVQAVSKAADAITGALLGGGNPASDVCNSVTDKAVQAAVKPALNAVKRVGGDVLDQFTTWVSEGAGWLIGKVAASVDETTTPQLSTRGFLSAYAKMAKIAVVLAAAMLALAILESVAQGSWSLLAHTVVIKVPLAFLATSVGFALVQLLLIATDGMCHAIAAVTRDHSRHFFRSAVATLGAVGATAGSAASDPTDAVAGAATGATVPLFVSFIVAIIGAFAAFFVWLELLMRDAAVYVVALFMPLSLATSISPRWSGVLRRSIELLVVVIASKFVIVAIIALASGLIDEGGGGLEPLLAATALMLLACFAPFVLLKLVPFAEGAMSGAYGRRSAAGGAVGGIQLASDAQMIRNMARSHWQPPKVWEVVEGGAGGSGSGAESSAARPGPPAGSGAGVDSAAPTAVARGAASSTPPAASAASAVAAAPAAAAAGVKQAGARAQQTISSETAAEASGGAAQSSPKDAELGAAGGGEERTGGGETPPPAHQEPPARPPRESPLPPATEKER